MWVSVVRGCVLEHHGIISVGTVISRPAPPVPSYNGAFDLKTLFGGRRFLFHGKPLSDKRKPEESVSDLKVGSRKKSRLELGSAGEVTGGRSCERN